MNRPWLMLIGGFLSVCPPCAGGSVTQTNGAAAIAIHWEATEPTLELADLITVTLTVEGIKPLATPIAPLELGDGAKWQLVQRSKPSREEIGVARERWRLTYHFAPREPGRIAFHFAPVKYRDDAGREQTATWDPVAFEVKTPPGGELRDITGSEAPPPLAPPDFSWWIWPVAAVLALLMVGLAVGLQRFFRRTKAPTPTTLALDAWRRLLAKHLAENGHTERFITLLSILMRRYLERQFALPARRRTTPEFLRQLASCLLLDGEEKQFLTTFLERSDAIKFAKSQISADECRAWADKTRQFLERQTIRAR